MEFGINFFPVVDPESKGAAQYYEESLRLVEAAEAAGFAHVQTVEHYCSPYGGYSPDPVLFLTAAAMRTSRIRLITGAVIAAFEHPVKLASRLAVLDNLSRGRLDVGFGRGFLPREFDLFGFSMDESRARFQEGIEACRRLWSETDVVWDGKFHSFGPVTLSPRPYSAPHPRIYVASASTPDSCAAAAVKATASRSSRRSCRWTGCRRWCGATATRGPRPGTPSPRRGCRSSTPATSRTTARPR